MVGDARALYSMGAVAAMLELSPATLRSWEDRYGVVVPKRSDGGHRLYSRDQLDQLRFVKASMEQGLSAADAHRILRQQLESGERFVAERVTEDPFGFAVLLIEHDPYGAELIEFFLRTEGYRVELAGPDMADVERKLAESRPRVVIASLVAAGGVNGALWPLLERTPQIATIVISSLGLQEEALAAGAVAFLPKPVDPLQLISAIKDVTGSSALLRSRTRR